MAGHIGVVVCGGNLVFGYHETYIEVSLRSMSIKLPLMLNTRHSSLRIGILFDIMKCLQTALLMVTNI